MVAALLLLPSETLHAQTTAFTFQGRLNDHGNPASGIYDLQFTVCDALTNGNVVGGPLTSSATGVSNGLFCVTLDFGGGVFTGPNRWLEIATRTNGAAAFTTLAPRQALTPAPYALYASSAGSASGVSGSVSASQISGTLALAQLPGAVLTNNEQGVSLAGSLTGNLIGNAATATVAGAANTLAAPVGVFINTNIIIGQNFPLGGLLGGWNTYFTNAFNGTYIPVSGGHILLTNANGRYYGNDMKYSSNVITNSTANSWTLVSQWMNLGTNISGSFYYPTNITYTNITINAGLRLASLTLPDGSVSNLSDLAFTIPWAMQNALAAKCVNSSTAFWDTNGNDGSAALGGTPSATLANAISLLPAGGGVVWLTPHQTFILPAAISFTKPLVLVALGNDTKINLGQNVGHGGCTAQCSANLTIIGGQWDLDWPNVRAGIRVDLEYASFFPDSFYSLNEDVYNLGSGGSAIQTLNIDHCKFFSTFDCFNQSTFPVLAGSIENIKDSWIISQGVEGLGDPARGVVVSGPQQLLLQRDLIVAVNSASSVTETNVCIEARNGAQVTLDGNLLVSGTPNYDAGVDVKALNSGTSVYVKNESYPQKIYTDGAGQIIGPINDSSLSKLAAGNGSGLTNLSATSLAGALPTANLPGITTNVSVSRLTFHITNGLIMRVSSP